MKHSHSIYLLWIFLCLAFQVRGQDTIVEPFFNPLAEKYLSDSLRPRPAPIDSFIPKHLDKIFLSPDSLDATVEYGSIDSNYFDNGTREVHLFGKAYVRYKDLSLKADYIIVNLDSSIATAVGLPDSLGNIAGNPEFTMADESFTAEKMRYNFKKRKGVIYNALTKENDLLIHGERTKFVAGGQDSLHTEDVLYGKRALITTCDHPSPHFGIRATKIKTIPDKLAVIGPSNLEIFGVPTPVWLPFGFYPVSETRTAGIIFPRDYEQSPQWGFGLRELGYYFPVKDWADVKLIGDIYFNGSWGIGVTTNYVQKYKFRGNVDLRYSVRINEPNNTYEKLKDKSFSIRITHNQDAKAHPYQTIGGSVNVSSNNYDQLNFNDAQSALTNSYSSNFNYSRTFPGKPYSLTAAMNHSQNTRSHVVTINAPELNFRLNRIYPFKRQKRTGPEQWYEKIAFQYTGSGRAQIVATDTTLFEAETWNNAQWGAQHRANANLSFSILKNKITFTPAVDYGETWFFKTQDRAFRFDPTDPDFVKNDTIWFPDSSGFFIQPDTISFGKVDPSLQSGFQAFRTISASMNINTQLYGMLTFGKGWLRAIRHTVKPSIGFSFSPASPDSYYQYQRFSVLYPDSTQRFSRFDNLLYGVRPTDIRQANIIYSINNLFEAKFFSKRDSTEKKIKLFDNIAIGGSYNIAAKNNKFSPVNISGNTRFFKGITTLTVGATYSFYALRANGQVDTVFYSQTSNHLLRFDNLRLRFSTRLTFNDIKKIFSPAKEGEGANKATIPGSGPKALPDNREKFLDLLNNFAISHEMGVVRMGMTGRDTTVITTHSINLVGSMRLTPNWSINFGNVGYDFKSKQLTYPDVGIARDLHCWQLSFNWQPDRGTYSFNLGVKPGTFDFLKFPYRRGNQDAPFGF